MQIQISWLLKKPTDLDLHCLQKQGISGFSRTRVNIVVFFTFFVFHLLYFDIVWSVFLSAHWRLIGLGRYPCWSDFPGCPCSQFVGFVKGWLIWWKTSKTRRPFTFEHNGTVAQLLECPFFIWKLVGLIPSQVIPWTWKMVQATSSLALSIGKAELVDLVSV